MRAVDSRNSTCRPDASFVNYRIMMVGFVPDVKETYYRLHFAEKLSPTTVTPVIIIIIIIIHYSP